MSKKLSLIILTVVIILALSRIFSQNRSFLRALFDTQKTSTALKADAPSVGSSKKMDRVDTGEISLFDTSLRSYGGEPVSGDLRPLWVISGRIRNGSHVNVSHVKVRVLALADGGEIDEDTVDIATDIEPDGAESFSKMIHLLPPKRGKWTYDLKIVQADAARDQQ